MSDSAVKIYMEEREGGRTWGQECGNVASGCKPFVAGIAFLNWCFPWFQLQFLLFLPLHIQIFWAGFGNPDLSKGYLLSKDNANSTTTQIQEILLFCAERI